MATLNLINSALINVGGTAGGLLKDSGLLEKSNQKHGKVTFYVPGVGTVFSCDATIQETHNFESTATIFPVEDGSTISDHVIQTPPAITFTGVVTDTPLVRHLLQFAETEISAAVSGFIPPLGVTVAGAGLAAYNLFRQSPKRSQLAYDTLVKLRLGDPTGGTPPTPFTLITKYHRYGDMVITSLSFPVDASTDGQCVFTVTCQKIVLVTPVKVNTQSLANAATSAQKQKLGNEVGGNHFLSDGDADGYSDTDKVLTPAERLIGLRK